MNKIPSGPLSYIRGKWQLYLLLIPPLLYFILFKYVPMLGVVIAFKDYSPLLGIWGSKWIGFAKFRMFFNSYMFERVIKNTLSISFYQIIAGFPMPIILALLLNCVRAKKFKRIVQTTTYIPHFISMVVLVGMIIQFMNPNFGLYGILARALTNQKPADLLGKADFFPHLYVWSGVWQNMGWAAIIYLAALSSADPQLHDAAMVDGATRFQRVRHIDFPCIVPTAVLLLILRAGSVMSVGFEKAYLMQNPLNLRTSMIISTYVFEVGLGSGLTDFSYATAIGLFNSVVNLVLILFVNSLSRKMGQPGLF